MRRRRPICFAPLLALAALLVAAPLRAQTPPEKVAEKAVKAAVKTSLKDLKAAVKVARADFDDGVDDFAESAATGSEPGTALEILVETWTVAHEALRAAVVQEQSDVVEAATNALGAYQIEVQGEPGGPYPKALLAGAGTGMDDFVAGWRKELAKAETQMAARLAKLRKKLAAAGRDFLVTTRPMVLEDAHSMNMDDTGFGGLSIQLTQSLAIQLAASLGISGEADDPAIALAGGGWESQTVHIDIDGALLDPLVDDVSSDSAGHWSFVAPALHRGSYVVIVSQAGDVQEARAPLGVR